MEKVVYLLWRDLRTSRAEFGERLRVETAAQLAELGVPGLQLNIADEAVSAAAPGVCAVRPQMDAMVSVWLQTAHPDRRRPVDERIGRAAARFAAYLVTESQPIVNTRYSALPGERTAGFAQVALLQRPPRLSHEHWLDIWLGSHTQIAIDTQDTFLYVQNVVTRVLTFDAPRYDAIVEEGFPPAAFGNQHAFYGAAGDEEKFRRHRATMRDSSKRFIDLDRLDVLQTSQYVFKTPG